MGLKGRPIDGRTHLFLVINCRLKIEFDYVES
jgi:hypothetical protein